MQQLGDSRLRFGVLSTADIARRKVIPGMRRSARCEVVAIASRDERRARAVATELDIPTSHGSYEALLADPNVDAVYIPLPNHLHAEWTIAAARAGKHVLCEKPLALAATEAETMIEASRNAGVVLMEAFMYRHHPSWVAARELVTSGRIGRLMAVQSWFSFFNDDPTNIRNIRDFGGGAMYDIGCYAVNLSRMLFDREPDGVQASLVRDPTSGVDIVASAILRFGDGIASFTCSTRTESDQRVEIYGTTGRVSFWIPFNIPPDRSTRISVVAGGNPPVDPAFETLEFAPADPYAVEADLFAATILDGTPLPVASDDAVANLRTMEAIVDAAARG